MLLRCGGDAALMGAEEGFPDGTRFGRRDGTQPVGAHRDARDTGRPRSGHSAAEQPAP